MHSVNLKRKINTPVLFICLDCTVVVLVHCDEDLLKEKLNKNI